MKYVVFIGVILLLGVGVYFAHGQSEQYSLLKSANDFSDPVTIEIKDGETEEENTDNEEMENENIVSYASDGFFPKTLVIEKETEVIFENKADGDMWVALGDHDDHTDASDKVHKTGESFTYTFIKEGDFSYHNHLSPGHSGLVVVK